MLGLFLPPSVARRVHLVGLVLLLLLALGLRRCTQPAPAPPTCSVLATSAQRMVATLPVGFRLPRPTGRWVALGDTSRAGGPAHLLRKATPRSQWLPAQPAYLPPLHRRPRQALLDSLARASMLRQ